MDFLANLRTDPGALIVGGIWALVAIWYHITQNARTGRQQAVVDKATSTLVASLQTSMTHTAEMAQEERDRADRLMLENTNLNVTIGELKSDIKHAIAQRDELAAQMAAAKITVDQLVTENRNKDRSITHLTELNRKLLESIGSSGGALEKAPAPNGDSDDDVLS